MYICDATKVSASVVDECVCLVEIDNKTYTVKDYDSCVSYLMPLLVNEWGNSEEILQALCRGEVVYDMTFSENIKGFIEFEYYTEDELIENNVINTLITNKVCITEGTDASCFEFDASTGTITDYDISCGSDVIIPGKIDGTEVTTIGEFAFSNSDGDPKYTSQGDGGIVEKIIIPDSVQYIKSYAFLGNSIKNITFSKNLKEIGYNAFRYNDFEGELDLSELINLTTIGSDAFYGNNITNVLLPNSIENIGNYAFRFNNITNIVNPSGNSFDWYSITGGTGGSSSACTFVTGTCGNITITAE